MLLKIMIKKMENGEVKEGKNEYLGVFKRNEVDDGLDESKRRKN